MSTLERMLAVLKRSTQIGGKGLSAQGLSAEELSPATVSGVRRRGRAGRRGAVRKATGNGFAAESLEQRLAFSVAGFLSGNVATLVAAPESDLYVTKVVNGDIWYDDNSSFTTRGTLASGVLSSVQTLSVISGRERQDLGVRADGSPMLATNSLQTSFALQHMYLVDSGELSGDFSCVQPDGTTSTWHFTSEQPTPSTYDYTQIRITSGPGWDGKQATNGYFVPTRVLLSNKVNNAGDDFDLGASTIDVDWNQPLTVAENPTLVSATYTHGVFWDPGLFGYTLVTRGGTTSTSLASVGSSTVYTLPSAAESNGLRIISGTLSGTLSINGIPLDFTTAVGSTALNFIGNARNPAGGLLGVTGRYTDDGKVYVSFQGDANPREQNPGPATLSTRYAVFATSPTASNVGGVTVYAGHDITQNININLLSPGSTVNFDSPITAPDTFSVSATNINVSSRLQTQGVLSFGDRSVSGGAIVVRNAAATAQVDKDGSLLRVSSIVGSEGAGYSLVAPPTVLIDAPVRRAVGKVSINGSLESIVLGNGGSGYNTAPLVTVSAPAAGGTQATATAVVLNGSVTGFTITNKGSGYTENPTIRIAQPTGGGFRVLATASAIASGSISAISLTDKGAGYGLIAPTVSITSTVGGAAVGTGAIATATVGDTGNIESIDIIDGGQNYRLDGTTVITVQEPPRQASLSVSRVEGGVSWINVTSGGKGYTEQPDVIIPRPKAGGRQAKATAVVKDGVVIGITVTDPGTGYTAPPIVQIQKSLKQVGNVVETAQASSSISGAIKEIVVKDGGAGYTGEQTVIFGGGDDSAQARAVVAEGKVIAVIIDDGGFGYTVDDATKAAVAAPDGYRQPVAAEAVAQVDERGIIVGYQVESVGINYTTPPRVTIDRPVSPVDAVGVTATISESGALESLNAPALPVVIVAPGKAGAGYDGSTMVTIAAPIGGGLAATAVPVVINGRIAAVRITNPGSGYVLGEQPAVTITCLTSDPTEPATAECYTAIGYGYRSAPDVLIASPPLDGDRAVALAELDSEGRIKGFTVFSGGSGYLVGSEPIVFVAGVSQKGVTENVNFNANVAAGSYVIKTADDPGTESDRGRLFVSPTSSLARNFDATLASDQIQVTADQSDVSLLGRVFVTTQTWYMPSQRTVEDVTPFTLTTRSATTGRQQGLVRGQVVQVLLANDAATPGDDTAVAFNTIDLQTAIESLRVRAATRGGLPRRDPFPYAISILEAGDTKGSPESPNLNIDAVAASSMPITVETVGNGALKFTSALATAGDVNLTAGQDFSLSAPLSTTLGAVRVKGSNVEILNSVSVTDSPNDDARTDIQITATNNILLGYNLRARNEIQLEQSAGTGKITGVGTIFSDSLRITAAGDVSLTTDVNTLAAKTDRNITISELGDIVVSSLVSKGLVTLTASGVDPALDRPALKASLTDVSRLNVSAPNGSINVEDNTTTPLLLEKGPNMLAGGHVRIRSSGGSTNGQITALDAPLAGSGAREVKGVVITTLAGVYDPKIPGLYASTITASGNGKLPVDGVRVNDAILVAGGVTGGVGSSSIANGVYTVTSLGSGTTQWKLTRSPSSDTAAELPANTFVGFKDGSLPSSVYQVTYSASTLTPFGRCPITVSSAAVVTNIGSDDTSDLLTFVVTSGTGSNITAGSLGKMLALIQGNDTSGEANNPSQKMEFRFADTISTIQPLEELPRIQKRLIIDGNQRYTTPVVPPATPTKVQKIFVDGSLIRSTITGLPVPVASSARGFEFSGAGAASSSLSNVSIGGFATGPAVKLNGVSGVRLDSLELGRSPNGDRLLNRFGVLVTGASSGNSILRSTMVGSSQAGIRVEGTATGTTIVGNAIGLQGRDNRVGIEIDSTGANRIGVDPLPSGGATVTVSATSPAFSLPAAVDISKLFVGQGVTGTGIAAGTSISAIDTGSRLVTLSQTPLQSGAPVLTFAAPTRNVIQSNLDGVVLTAGSTTVTNSELVNNTFDGIRVSGSPATTATIGTTSTAGAASNAIFGNGRWGVSILAPVLPSAVKITGNFFGVTSLNKAANPNAAGNIGVNGAVAPPSLNYIANPTTGVDVFGNQYGVVTVTPTTPGTGTGTGTGPKPPSGTGTVSGGGGVTGKPPSVTPVKKPVAKPVRPAPVVRRVVAPVTRR